MIPLEDQVCFGVRRGRLSPRKEGVFAAPDYKALYFELFRASEQAARLLWEAQQKAEQEALRADPPPLELLEQPKD